MTVPALPQPNVWHEAGQAWTNSRDVATYFGKRHDNVLRDIEALEMPSDLRASWFRVAPYTDSYARTKPATDMTKDGFTLLAMGYTGARAMEFKVRYIEAFNALLQAQHDSIVSYDQLLGAIKETVAPLAVRFDYQDTAIGELAEGVDQLNHRMDRLEAKVGKKPRMISAKTKAEHTWAISQLGGKCPGCGVNDVVNPDGTKSPFAEFDHFYENSLPNIEHTWLICKLKCHDPLTRGKIARHEMESDFRAYQRKRRSLNGRQCGLFD